MWSRQRYKRVSLILPSSICSRSSSAVDGYQRCSIASSLPGAQRRLIASSAATRDHGTSTCSPSTACSKKRSSSSRFHNSNPRKQAPNCRVLSSRTLFNSTRGYLRIVLRRRHMRGKQLELLRFALLVEDLNGGQPARLRGTV